MHRGPPHCGARARPRSPASPFGSPAIGTLTRATVPAWFASTIGCPKIGLLASSFSEQGKRPLDHGCVDLSGDGDLDWVSRLLRELLFEEEIALLRLEAVGQRRRPGGACVECEHGGGEREQQAGGENDAQDGAAHHPVDDCPPDAPLPARLLGGEVRRKVCEASSRGLRAERERRGRSVDAAITETIATRSRPRRGSGIVLGTSRSPSIASTNAIPLKERLGRRHPRFRSHRVSLAPHAFLP